MTIGKKVVTSRLNGRRSPGPRTERGKNNSRRNAVKHGLFSKELVFSDIEKAEFQALHRSVQSQLQPKTALQSIALEEIVCCTWRCKLATRQETQHLRALLDVSRDGEPQPEEPIASAAMTRWFGSGRRELNEAIRILQALEGAVRTKGRVPAEWKERLDRAFGVEFYESLVEWPTISIDAIQMAVHVVRHRATYGNPGADQKDSGRTGTGEKTPSRVGADDNDSPEVVLDPFQNLNMILKLIQQLIRVLRDLARSSKTRESTGQSAGATDFAPRYFTTATRDLHRAVEWYAHLKERKL